MHTRAHLQHTHTHIKYMFYSNPIYESALYEAAQPSAAHAWLLRQAHADCMSSSISMLQAWSCGYTASLSLPLSTSLLCFPLSFMSYLHLVLSAHLPGRADSRSHPPSVQSRSWFGLVTEELLCIQVFTMLSLLVISWQSSCCTSVFHVSLPPSLCPCTSAGSAVELLGPSEEQHAQLIIQLGFSHIG